MDEDTKTKIPQGTRGGQRLGRKEPLEEVASGNENKEGGAAEDDCHVQQESKAEDEVVVTDEEGDKEGEGNADGEDGQGAKEGSQEGKEMAKHGGSIA